MPEAVNKKPHIRVSAGLLLRPDGQLLLAQRPQGKPWAGWWELPGGKLDAGETVLQALARELFEELGVRVTQAVRWVKYVHEYTDNIVELNFCRVTGWQGTPSGCENQALVEIISGLSEGQQVVVSGQIKLSDGMAVTPSASNALAAPQAGGKP